MLHYIRCQGDNDVIKVSLFRVIITWSHGHAGMHDLVRVIVIKHKNPVFYARQLALLGIMLLRCCTAILVLRQKV